MGAMENRGNQLLGVALHEGVCFEPNCQFGTQLTLVAVWCLTLSIPRFYTLVAICGGSVLARHPLQLKVLLLGSVDYFM